MTAWTPQELSALHSMAEEGCSETRAAARLKRSIVAVKKRARELGLNLKDKNDVRLGNGLTKSWVQNCTTK